MPETSLHIWYAEDDEEDRLFFRECIVKGNEPVKLKEYEDGSAVIKHLLTTGSDNLPDIIISDIKMPVVDGAGLLGFLKEHKQFEHIPVIIFSTSSSSFDKKQCFELGAKAYFSKPSSLSELKSTVFEMISLCRAFVNSMEHSADKS